MPHNKNNPLKGQATPTLDQVSDAKASDKAPVKEPTHQVKTNLPPVGKVDSHDQGMKLELEGQRQVTPQTTASTPPQAKPDPQVPRLDIAGKGGQSEIAIQHISPVVPKHIDRVRAFSDPAINALIDEGIRERLTMYAGQSHSLISKRINELDQEWDIERFMGAKASGLAFIGLVLGLVRGRKWLMLPLLALPFMFQHATTGTCMVTPLVRRMGFRTRYEIEAEKYALKVLRGDFGDLDADVQTSVTLALEAVKR